MAPCSSQSRHTAPNTPRKTPIGYHSQYGVIKAIAGLSAIGARRSRRRLTLVRDEANLGVLTKLHIMTYNDPFYWNPSRGR